jgi:hypothetical protein
MKKQLTKSFILSVCTVICVVAIDKTVKTNIRSLRSDYYINAKGKAQHFITTIIQ